MRSKVPSSVLRRPKPPGPGSTRAQGGWAGRRGGWRRLGEDALEERDLGEVAAVVGREVVVQRRLEPRQAARAARQRRERRERRGRLAGGGAQRTVLGGGWRATGGARGAGRRARGSQPVEDDAAGVQVEEVCVDERAPRVVVGVHHLRPPTPPPRLFQKFISQKSTMSLSGAPGACSPPPLSGAPGACSPVPLSGAPGACSPVPRAPARPRGAPDRAGGRARPPRGGQGAGARRHGLKEDAVGLDGADREEVGKEGGAEGGARRKEDQVHRDLDETHGASD